MSALPSAGLRQRLRRDRAWVLAGLIAVCGLSWIYMAHLGARAAMGHPSTMGWDATVFALVFVMWSVMMVAMMIPAAAPVILTYASVERRRHHTANPLAPTAFFVGGYLVIWTAFSLLATVAQWILHTSALLSSMMGRVGPAVGGGLLVAAGIFQWMPLKQACLRHCRTPMSFLLSDWRDGRWGAFVMGVEHGAICTVCCWALMSLMFVLGVMNVVWMAILTAVVFVEKVFSGGDRLGRWAGVGLVVWGLVAIIHGVQP